MVEYFNTTLFSPESWNSKLCLTRLSRPDQEAIVFPHFIGCKECNHFTTLSDCYFSYRNWTMIQVEVQQNFLIAIPQN